MASRRSRSRDDDAKPAKLNRSTLRKFFRLFRYIRPYRLPFVAGLVLGWFRWATGSTILSIGMHILVNCQSMLGTWIKMEFFP